MLGFLRSQVAKCLREGHSAPRGPGADTGAAELSLTQEEVHAFRGLNDLVNRNGSIPYSALFVRRLLEGALALVPGAGKGIAGANILELGSSPRPGLPLTCLLLGARSVTVNNVVPIERSLSDSSCALALLLLGARAEVTAGRLAAICGPVDSNGRRVLDREKFAVFAPMPGEELPDEAGGADLVFSFSVLEHVRRPREFLRRAFELTAPGGVHVHTIDLRDHRDFLQPLDFLGLSADQYIAATGGSENRLRSCEQLDLFREVGFEILATRWMDRVPSVGRDGSTALVDWHAARIEDIWTAGSHSEIRPWVDESMRATFQAPWSSMTLEELSAMGVLVVARRPAE
jgi:SAM-dependent methyltransferase